MRDGHFTPTEAVTLGKLIEEEHRPKVLQAKRANLERAKAIRQGLIAGDSPGAATVGYTRETAAAAVGMSGWAYDRAKKVVAAAEAEPERFGDLPARMDETGNVLGAYRELERRRSNTGRHAVHSGTIDRKPNDAMQRAVLAFDGLCTGLRALDLEKLDPTKTEEWSKELAETATFLRGLSLKMKVSDVK